jgi:hypothetical protein
MTQEKKPLDSVSNDSVEAVVADVVRARRGYAITYLREPTPEIPEGESVTFSLTKWTGKIPPEAGQCVRLENLQRFENGWRAAKASPITQQQ